MQDLGQQAVKSVFWVGSTQAVGQVISSIVATIYLMRILSPADYGLVGMALSYQAILFILYDLCIGAAIVQKKDLAEEDIHSAFWFSTAFGVILFAITWHVSVLVGDFYSDTKVVALVRALAVGNIFLAIKEVPYCIMARNFEFKRRGIAELISGMLSLAVSLILAIRGFGAWSLIIGQVSREFCLTVLILYLSKWKIRFCFRISRLKPLLKFGIPITGQQLLEFFYQGSDSVIIGRFSGKDALGYYQVAVSLAYMPLQKVVGIANKVLFPVFAKLQAEDEKMKAYFYKVFHLITLFSFPVLFGLLCVSEEVVILILSPKWAPCLPVLKIFCIIAIFRAFMGFFVIILKARGNTSAVFKYSLYSSLVLPVAFLIGVRFGILGVAFAWLICFPILCHYLFWLVQKEIHISPIGIWNKTSHALFASIAMMASTFLVKQVLMNHYSMSFFTFGAIVAAGMVTFIGYYGIFCKPVFFEIREIGASLLS